MLQLVSQTDVEGIKQKMLSNVDGGDNEALVILHFIMALSIPMEEKIHFINNILLSEISQIVTSCLNIHIQATPFSSK